MQSRFIFSFFSVIYIISGCQQGEKMHNFSTNDIATTNVTSESDSQKYWFYLGGRPGLIHDIKSGRNNLQLLRTFQFLFMS